MQSYMSNDLNDYKNENILINHINMSNLSNYDMMAVIYKYIYIYLPESFNNYLNTPGLRIQKPSLWDIIPDFNTLMKLI